MKLLVTTIALCILMACGEQGSTTNQNEKTKAIESAKNKVTTERNNPQVAAVQQYQEKVPNDLNNWYFKVELFETAKRFTYQLRLQYEEVSGDDSITFPNLGIEPQPILKKGSGKYECMIGFLDNKGTFREYKKVHIVDGNLKVTTLKSYAVSVQ